VILLGVFLFLVGELSGIAPMIATSASTPDAPRYFVAVWRPGSGRQQWETGMTVDAFRQKTDQLFGQGLRIRAVDAYRTAQAPRSHLYTAVWGSGSGAQFWKAEMSATEFEALDTRYSRQGFRIAAIDVQDGRIMAAWRPGSGIQVSRLGISLRELLDLDSQCQKRGLRLAILKQYASDKFAAVWRPDSLEVRWETGLTTEAFRSGDADNFNGGLRLECVSTYEGKLTVVWRRGSGTQWIKWGLTDEQLRKQDAMYYQQGLRLVLIGANTLSVPPQL
jgi:hypothetical protein